MTDRPKIVAERKRRAREMKPPHDIIIHEWGKPYAGIEVYISQRAFDLMMKQCALFAKRHLEALGYLVGDYCRWKNREYTIVEDAVTSDLETTSVSVHFQAFEKAFDKLDRIDFDYVIVGWYHSHPGHGCFMSQTDISTQKRMFNKPFHIAAVIDPINKEFKVYKMSGNVAEEKVFAIYRNLDRNSATSVEPHGPGVDSVAAEAGPLAPEPREEPQRQPPRRPRLSAREREERRKMLATNLLFLLPLLFAGFGGAAGFVLSMHRDRPTAWAILAVGALMTAVWALLGPLLVMG
ncbi:MAG: Mov34/MPN/PAD-1 family protein [Thermoplasmatota archaeon]